MLNKVIIHPFTYIVLLISFLASYFEKMYLLLLIILVHEFGHLIMINLFNYDVSKIIIYPFGGLTTYDSKVNEKIYKELLICISGPLVQLLFMFVVYLLKKYIYLNTYNSFVSINILLFRYNLLPIFPLDGGRLLNLVLDYIFPYRVSMHLISIISLILNVVLIIYFISCKDIFVTMLFIITLTNVIKEIRNIKYKYNKFLLERLLDEYDYKYGRVINDISRLKKNRYNKIIKNNIVYNEKDYLKKYVFNI